MLLKAYSCMTPLLKDLAIKNALENNWKEACKLNLEILKDTPLDVDTLNRLAFAFVKLGNYKKAKDTYKKAIKLDKTNPIALKNLKKIDSMPKRMINASNTYSNKSNQIQITELFIEEAGKTRIVELKNITDKVTLSILQPGDEVQLVIKRSKIFVQSDGKKYIGMLPDNIGTRLILFIKSGNEYQAFIKALHDKSVVIFIKETKRSKRFKYQPSFTSSYSSSSLSDLES